MSGNGEINRGGNVVGREARTVSLAKYNDQRKELEKLRSKQGSWITGERKMAAELDRLSAKLRRTEDALKRKKIYRGRNKTKTCEFDEDEHAMNKDIGLFIQQTVFPNTKFLHSTWSEYAPEVERSFFSKIKSEVVIFPGDIEESVFWVDKVVPIVNKKICETRANITSTIRQGYIRKCVADIVLVNGC